MTAQEFVTWFKGFVAGSNNYNLTPKGWDEVKKRLDDVNDTPRVSTTFTAEGNTTATTLPPGTLITFTTSDKNLLHD